MCCAPVCIDTPPPIPGAPEAGEAARLFDEQQVEQTHADGVQADGGLCAALNNASDMQEPHEIDIAKVQMSSCVGGARRCARAP